MNKYFLYDFESDSVKHIFIPCYRIYSKGLPLDSKHVAARFHGLCDAKLPTFHEIIASLKPTTTYLLLTLLDSRIDVPPVIPFHIRHLFLNFDLDSVPFLKRLLDNLPVVLETLDLPFYIPIENPPPALKFINMPASPYISIYAYSIVRNIYCKTADDYFCAIPSVQVVRFGVLTSADEHSFGPESSIVFSREAEKD